MIIAALCFLLAQQQPSYLLQAIPHPTGNNGWEEYLMAADIVRRSDVARTIYDADTIPLVRDRTSISKYGKICDLVRVGNSKPLIYPWPVSEYQVETFPAYAQLKVIGAMLSGEAQADFASGRPSAGARDISNLLKFGRRIVGKTTVEALVSIAVQSQAMRALDLGKHKLGSTDAATLAMEFSKAALEPSPLIETCFRELSWFRRNVRDFIMAEARAGGELAQYATTMSDAQMEASTKVALAEVDRMERALRKMFAQEERSWAMPEIQVDDPTANLALQYILPSTTAAMVRNLTQLRLAAIHCKIMEYKRKRGEFPTKLADLEWQEAMYDRTTGGPYFYARLSPQSYILYSLGTAETGRIDLVYRRQSE
jgi:hypothetical protein